MTDEKMIGIAIDAIMELNPDASKSTIVRTVLDAVRFSDLRAALEQIASVKPEVSNERFRFFALATADAALSLPENAEDRKDNE